MSDLKFIGTAEGLNGKVVIFEECGKTFMHNQSTLEQRIANLRANDSEVSPAEIAALEVLKKENGAIA